MSTTFERSVFPFLNQTVDVSKHMLDIDLPGLNSVFEACPYTKKNTGGNQILYDTTVRNCEKAQIAGEKFISINSTLSTALTLPN